MRETALRFASLLIQQGSRVEAIQPDSQGRGLQVLAALVSVLLGLICVSITPAHAAEVAQPYFIPLSDETAAGRQGAVAAALPDGRVLIAGGADDLALRSAEIFDPATSSFGLVAGLTRYKRVGATAARLPDGRVLIAGGAGEILRTDAEIFDPATETFTDASGEMTTGRINGIAAPLPDGRVLIAGGFAEGNALDTAEVFDPTTETFTLLSAKMWSERSSAVAVPLPSGTVLIAGGHDETDPARSAEVFDPATHTFSVINRTMTNENRSAVAALLASGKILIAGGLDGDSFPIRDAGLFDPASATFAPLPKSGVTELTTERASAIATPLPDGSVLIAGGSWPDARHSAERFVSAPAIGSTGGDFGSWHVGQPSVPSTVVVTNLGAQPLEIDAISLEGADAGAFTIVSDSCTGETLGFKQSCGLSLRFTPSRPGVTGAALRFDDNEPSSTSVPVTGIGVAPVTDPFPSPLMMETPRQPTSVRCKAKPIARTKKVTVRCRVNPGAGVWEGQLIHAGRTVARRRLAAGPQWVTFRVMRRQRNGYRLQLLPLP